LTDEKSPQNWQRMWFKGHKVWVELDDKGEILLKHKKAHVKYNLKQPYEYWVYPSALSATEEPPPKGMAKAPQKKRRRARSSLSERQATAATLSPRFDEADTIHIFTDGASSGNPGPSGIGVLLIYGKKRKEISRFIGQATNNIAELEAIRAVLSALKTTHLPIKLYTDSSYAMGVLTKSWKAQKNRELIARIKSLMTRFKNLELVKVPGHAGLPENERADHLAVSAAKQITDIEDGSAGF
jgi:ribonuclease HI